jgi:transcriptional regulator with XRE-family HTH domain
LLFRARETLWLSKRRANGIRHKTKPGINQQEIIAMKQNEEKPVNCKQAREILGWGTSYMSAVRRAMGISSRYFFVSDVRKSIRDNPTFTSSQIYHKRTCKCEKCALKPTKPKRMKKKPNTPIQNAADSVPTIVDESASTPLKYGQLFGERVRALRGDLSVAQFEERTGLSHETLRKAELGVEATRKTMNGLRKVIATETDWLELLSLWVKMQVGNDAGKLQIGIIPPHSKSKNDQHPQNVEPIIDYYRALKPVHKKFMFSLMSSTDKITALCNFMDFKETEVNSNDAAETAAYVAQEPQNGLWASM